MIRYRPQAKHDLIDIALWYETQTPGLSERFIDATEMTLAQLEQHPLSGAEWDFSPSDLQHMRHFPIKHPFDIHLLFYLPVKDGIELVRVLHSKRDILAILSL